MSITRINAQLLDHLPAKAVLRQHTLNCELDGSLRCMLDQFLEAHTLQAADVAGVAVVHLVRPLVPGNTYLFRVDDNNVVAGVDVRRVHRLVLPAQPQRDFRCQPTQSFISSINELPVPPHFGRFRSKCLHDVHSVRHLF